MDMGGIQDTTGDTGLVMGEVVDLEEAVGGELLVEEEEWQHQPVLVLELHLGLGEPEEGRKAGLISD